MGEYLKLIDRGADLAGLKDELDLIVALADTAKKWRELADKIEGASSLEQLLDRIAEDVSGEEVTRAFTGVGLGDAHATLVRLLGKLTAGAEKMPAKIKQLFEPLSTYQTGTSGLIEWKISGDEEAQLGQRVKLGIKGDAALTFDAAGKAKIGETQLDRLLRIGANAKVKATAAGTLPIRWGTVGGSGEAAVNVALDYYYKPADAASFYGAALAQRIVDLPDPFDYDSVWEAFESTHGLTGIVYSFSDSAKANLDLAVSASGSLTQDILADVKLTFGVKGEVDNRFLLALRGLHQAGQPPRIEAILSRGSSRMAGATLGLTVGVDLSVPLERVRDVLNRAIERSNEVIGEITPYLTPGTLLRTQFRQLMDSHAERLIQNEALRTALLKDMAAATGDPAADQPALVAWLSKEIAEAIDTHAKDLTEQAEGARDRMIEQVLTALPAPLRDQAREQAKVELRPLIDKAAGELTATVNRLIALPGNRFGKALKEIGAAADTQVDRLDKAMEPVRKLIDRYKELLDKAKEFADDAARAKVTARITMEELSRWGTEEKIVGTFLSKSPAAAALFEQISRGNVADLKRLLLEGSQTPDFELNKPKSMLKRTAQRTSTGSFELVLFGFGESGSVTLDAKAAVLVDGDGKVQVDADGKLTRRFKTSTEEREVTFVDTFSLLLAKATAGTAADKRSIEAGVSIMHVDKKLRLGELKGFVASLAKAGLVSADTVPAAEAQFRTWSPTGEAIAGDVAAKFQLTHDQLRTLMMLDQRRAGVLTDAARRRLIAAAVTAGEALGQGRANVRHGHRSVEAQFGIDPKPLTDFLLDRVREAGTRADVMKELDRDRSRSVDTNAILAEYKRMLALVDMVQKLGDIYTATPKVADPAPRGAWDERAYARAEFRLAEACSRWLHTGGGFFQISDEVAAVTVTFLATVCDLVGIPRLVNGRPASDGADSMALTVTRRKNSDSVEEAVSLTQVASAVA